MPPVGPFLIDTCLNIIYAKTNGFLLRAELFRPSPEQKGERTAPARKKGRGERKGMEGKGRKGKGRKGKEREGKGRDGFKRDT